MRRLAPLLTLLSLLAVPAAASAADFNPAAGTYTVDTTTLKLTGPGPTNITGVDQGGTAVFAFGDVNIVGGVQINASGTRPLKIVASGDLTLGGSINGSGTNANDFDQGPGSAGGPGGGAGGSGSIAAWTKGLGPGGGGKGSTASNGGAGGGFGGKGARGGVTGSGTGGAAGAVYGNLNGPLQGGSGGSGSSDASGGGGGGAIALFGSTVTVTGSVFVDGGGGAVGQGASGGGSGGGIVVHGDSVEVNGVLVARGANGGEGGCCGDGGGGGGGRIAYQFRQLVASGSTFITGGASGARNTGGCSCGHGGLSPDVTGAVGVVTKTTAATATTTPATGVAFNGATLNGSTNPHTSPTNYFFDFGTTTAYGSRTGTQSAGSGNAEVAVSAAIGGLAPSTTYHYRLVTVDSMGFTTVGTDIGFTTPAAPVIVTPPPPPSGGPPTTVVPSTTSINSLAFPKFTKLVNLSAKNLETGSTVLVTCKTKKKKQQKKGCPYKKKRFTTSGGRAKLNLLKPFKKKHLPVGTKITITITAPGFLGKRITYTVRARKLPKSKVQCLSASGKAGSCA
jgi:hypothetical protein